MNTRTKGNIGEDLAVKYLKKHGYKIVERNYTCQFGEIDIIAKDKDTIVFVEVKTRTNLNFGHPFEAINKTKLQHIYQTGLFYLQNTKEKYKNYRIDIIGITTNSDEKTPKVEHIKNINLN